MGKKGPTATPLLSLQPNKTSIDARSRQARTTLVATAVCLSIREINASILSMVIGTGRRDVLGDLHRNDRSRRDLSA